MQRCLLTSTNHLLLDLESPDDALSTPAMSVVFEKFAVMAGSRARHAHQRTKSAHMAPKSIRKAKAMQFLKGSKEWKVPFKA